MRAMGGAHVQTATIPFSEAAPEHVNVFETAVMKIL